MPQHDSDLSGREIETIGSSTPRERAQSSAIRARVTSFGGGLRASSGGGANVRESFAAALWNPMRDTDKDAFNRRRLMQLTAGVLIATCGGSAFAFGIFSNKIKESAQFTQAEMTTITTAGAILGAFTFPAGILFDYAGPQYVLLVATILSCTGFSLLAMIFQGIVTPTVYSVGAANALTNMGVGFTDCGSLMTNLFSFPVNRGEVLIIQKTFFGLGSTFLSLAFDGFFGPSENYIAYAVFVCILVFVAGTAGTLVTRLPPYKRTTRELRRIAQLDDPTQKELERLQEERSFELFHNPRLVDRRRLNAGVTCLIMTLIFFSSFSVIKTYVEIPSNVITGLTVLACLCLASFTVMIMPIKLPSFFDYEFLPDLHPPEALVDKPEGESDDDDDAAHRPLAGGRNDNDDKESVYSASKGREYDINASPDDLYNTGGSIGGAHGCEGRASAFMPSRQSVAGNSAPIAVPQGIAPSIIPSITTPFTKSLFGPMIWCFFITAFAMTGASALVVSNVAQIITSANGGVYDQKTNSLAVALQGIGSALGRIIIGFTETYFQRRNALAREAQLKWIAEHGDDDSEVEGGGNASHPEKPDMTPVFHRLSSSVVLLLPIAPALVAVCSVLCTFVPVGVIPVLICFLGGGYGSYLALLALGVREMFSVDVAQHYNFVGAAGMLSAILLNRLMFGTWFDEETEKHPAADGVSCVGHVCYANSFYVLAGLCGLAVISSSFIVFNWWKIRKTF